MNRRSRQIRNAMQPTHSPAHRSPALAAGLVGLGILLAFFGFTIAATNAPSIAALAELTKPAGKIPFKEVILATTGQRIIDFDTNNPAHVALHAKLTTAASAAALAARTEGLFSARANEAGNYMEGFVKSALQEAGLDARTPLTTTGSARSTGYPDLEIQGPVPCYLELKTYSATTANTTQRSFYYSPSETPKVTRNALHLLLAYQLERTERDGQTAFIPVTWKLITLEDLAVDLKFEFNQSNRGLYGKEAAPALLGEGQVD